MEDWNTIAAEVEDAIRSIADISQPDGYPVTLRIPTVTGPEYDPVEGAPVYKTLYCVEGYQEIRDQSGTLIGMTKHTLTVTANADAVPLKSYRVALGVTAEQADESSEWVEIENVKPLAPAGIVLLYDLDLVN